MRPQKRTVAVLYLVDLGILGLMTHAGSSVWIAEELGGWTPNCFLNPPNTLSNYVQGVSYILYTYDLRHKFGQSPTVEKFNSQLSFYNSNTGWKWNWIKFTLSLILAQHLQYLALNKTLN